MRISDLDIIFIPDSGALSPDYWVSRWSAKLSTARLLSNDGPLATPSLIVGAAASTPRPILLVGHSTGAIAAALAADGLSDADIKGAFLVAPPHEDSLESLDGGLWPKPPRARLPWPSVVIASRTDPWSSLRQSEALAQDWGAEFVDAGESGRLDADSGHGPWPDGLLRLAGFLKKLG